MPYNKNDTFDFFDFNADDRGSKGFTDSTGSHDFDVRDNGKSTDYHDTTTTGFTDMWDANYIFWQDGL